MKKILVIFALVFVISAQSASYNYDDMKKEQYDAALLEWRNKISKAEKTITTTNSEIEKLKKELAELNKSSDDTWNEIYAAAGENNDGTKADFDAYMSNVDKLRQDVSAFMNMSAEEAYKNRKDLDMFQTRLDAFKAKNYSALSAAEGPLASIQRLIDQGRNKAKLPNSMYRVNKGDYLWKIAKKDAIYGDPYAWTRLYNSNKDQIKDPNLIFPNQTFTVSRAVGSNKYLVVRGDNLFKIAQDRGSSFSWMQLYNANKSFLVDPNMIMPYQVLALPNN